MQTTWLMMFVSLSIFCPLLSAMLNFFFLPSLLFFSLPLFPSERAQLYQQYNEAAQNLAILSQSGSNAHPLPEDNTRCPAPSPPPASRPLPPLPSILHPHSLFHKGSFTSVCSLPLPEPPKSNDRPPSPRLSISLTQSSILWRDLPGVRNSGELEKLTEDQRRLQEVTHILHV